MDPRFAGDVFGALQRGVNKLGLDAYRGAGNVYKQVDKGVFGGALPYGAEPSSSGQNPLRQIKQAVTSQVNDAFDRGVIPVPTANRGGWAAATGLKAFAGPLGRPFRVMDNPDAAKYRQATLEAAQPQPDGSLSYGTRSTGEYGEKYRELKKDPANMAIGQWSGKPDRDGFVAVTDDYNTNNPLSWYGKKIMEGSIADKVYYSTAGAGKLAEEIGWLNQRPLGSSIAMGFVNPAD